MNGPWLAEAVPGESKGGIDTWTHEIAFPRRSKFTYINSLWTGKMVGILQTIYSFFNVISFNLTTGQHCFFLWLVPNNRPAIIWSNDLIHWRTDMRKQDSFNQLNEAWTKCYINSRLQLSVWNDLYFCQIMIQLMAWYTDEATYHYQKQ